MGNFSIQGQKYRHLPTGSECIILADHSERHRVRIKLDNGREMDEVSYHDVGPCGEEAKQAPAVVEAPAPEVVVTTPDEEDPEPAKEGFHPTVDPAEEYPRRGRTEWNRGTTRERKDR